MGVAGWVTGPDLPERMRSAATYLEPHPGAMRVADSGAGMGCGVVLGRCSNDRVSSVLDAVRYLMCRPFQLRHGGDSCVHLQISYLPP